ncbi:MAG: hypothetical protein KatS3mg111_2126 [Pirellulaceae bacterium]|nr:MAG: hypothetical protein KatS3mg111_2126 [Pirellulaceae bacterium]
MLGCSRHMETHKTDDKTKKPGLPQGESGLSQTGSSESGSTFANITCW